jgi:transcriptional regulator with XRE-family HTH domain
MPKQKFEHPVYGRHTVRIFSPDALREGREETGLSQEQVGVAIGIAGGTYRGYEMGNVSPQADTLTAIAKVLGVDVIDFFPIDEEKSSSAHAIWGGKNSPLISERERALKAEQNGGPYPPRDIGAEVLDAAVPREQLADWCHERGLDYDEVRKAANAEWRRRRASDVARRNGKGSGA